MRFSDKYSIVVVFIEFSIVFGKLKETGKITRYSVFCQENFSFLVSLWEITRFCCFLQNLFVFQINIQFLLVLLDFRLFLEKLKETRKITRFSVFYHENFIFFVSISKVFVFLLVFNLIYLFYIKI
jgi:hypothetical protein